MEVEGLGLVEGERGEEVGIGDDGGEGGVKVVGDGKDDVVGGGEEVVGRGGGLLELGGIGVGGGNVGGYDYEEKEGKEEGREGNGGDSVNGVMR